MATDWTFTANHVSVDTVQRLGMSDVLARLEVEGVVHGALTEHGPVVRVPVAVTLTREEMDEVERVFHRAAQRTLAELRLLV